MMISWPANVRESAVSDIVGKLSRDHMPFGYNSYEHIEDSPGLYSFWVRGTCLYVGMSTSLKRRLEEHCRAESNPILKEYFEAYKNEIMLSMAYKCMPDDKLLKLESRAISALVPIANRTGKA